VLDLQPTWSFHCSPCSDFFFEGVGGLWGRPSDSDLIQDAVSDRSGVLQNSSQAGSRNMSRLQKQLIRFG